MKKIILRTGFLLFIVCTSTLGNAQNAATNSGGQVMTIQPKIMVIPFTKENEDIRTILEEDVNRRIAITKVKEAFDSRGFSTVDFTAKLKSAKESNAFTSDNQTDIKAQIVQMSGADIYVQAEVSVLKSSTGNSVTVVLTAYEASTGNSLSNKVGESGKFYTDDYGKLASKAVENCATDFLDIMQKKFTDIVNNGKSVIVDISFGQNSVTKMSTEMPSSGLPLSDMLEEWMSKNAYKNSYHIQGTTDLKMIFDDVKIPLKDQVTGQNYNANRFALELFKYLKSINLNPKKDIKSNTIYITL